MRHKLCVFCGKRPATTSDHMPPKCIFPKPRPKLITVPSCLTCNHSASKKEQEFLVYLSLRIGIDSPETKQLWDRKALESIKQNRKLHRQILSSMRPVEIVTPGGLILGTGTAGLWKGESHDFVAERMIRGLYYYHYGEILGDKVKCKLQWLNELSPDLIETMKSWPFNVIGKEAVVYRHARAPEALLNSVWIFQFYKKHLASGYTVPVE